MRLMRDILTEIHAGKMSFAPRDESAEELLQFQAVAKRIEAAKQRGYIQDAKFERSRERGTYN